jgi:hypothetical protein
MSSLKRLSVKVVLRVAQLYAGPTVAMDVKLAMGAQSYYKHETRELGSLSRHTLPALEQIVGVDRHGERIEDAPTAEALRAQGSVWAQHVLEAPLSWIASAVYIAATVLSGFPGACQ